MDKHEKLINFMNDWKKDVDEARIGGVEKIIDKLIESEQEDRK